MGKNTSYGTFAQEWVDYAASKRVADFSEILALPINEGRNVVAQADKMAKPPMNGVVTETRMIDMADGAETEVVIFSPSVKPTGDAPLVLVLHGGGWFLGDANSEAIVIATLVEECGAVVVASHYRLAPEHPFPTPLNDGYDAFLWALKNSKSLGADPDKFLVAGSSAGGNLAAALCIKAKMAGMSTKIRGQLLIYPVTCDYRHLPNKFELEGYNGGDLPVLPRAAMSKFWGMSMCSPEATSALWFDLFDSADMYNASNSADPLCSPLLAEDLSGLPPARKNDPSRVAATSPRKLDFSD
ncbi:MAG: hypothetical protein M1819_001944 [Sarea resinae]|nr:MAG: hypothetical protein M1819_001944 [Sarea resinae]